MSQRGSLRKRGATWTAYWFVTSPEGERVQRSKGGFRTKADAQAHLTEQLSKLQQGTYTEPAKLTVAQYLRDEWLPTQRVRLKPSTLRGYEDIVEGRIVPHLGGIRLSALTGGHIARTYDELRTSGNRRGKGEAKGLSERSLKHTHTCLHKALEDAARRRLIARNPADDVEPPRPRNAEMKVWSPDEVRRFLASLANNRLRCAFTLALANGLRRGEILGLKWDDVDLDGGRLSVRRSRVAAGYKVHEGDP